MTPDDEMTSKSLLKLPDSMKILLQKQTDFRVSYDLWHAHENKAKDKAIEVPAQISKLNF